MKLLDRYRAIIRGDEPRTPVTRHLGIRMTAADPGLLTAELVLNPEIHSNINGTVHGGVLATLADTTLSCAFGSTLEEGEEVATLELKINYLRPAGGTRLSAVGRVVQRGRTVGMAECEITDDQGRLVAKASGTCMAVKTRA